MMLCMSIFTVGLLIVRANSIIDGVGGEEMHIMEAVNAVLGATPQERDFVLLFQEESGLLDVDEVRAPWGVGVFQVTADRQNTNVTMAQLSAVGDLARQLREVSWSVTVVVMSDDPAFLATFAEWSLKGRLLVWSTRLLVLTRLSLHRLQHLSNTLAMTNSMLLHLTDISANRINIYIALPFSTTGIELLLIAYWSVDGGLRKKFSTPYYPDKFAKFSNGARVVVSRVVLGEDKRVTVDDPDEPGEQKVVVFNPDNTLLEAVAENMNFTVKYVAPDDNHWGMMLPDGSWTGMVGMVYRQEADIGLGLFTMTEARFGAVDFTYPVNIIFVSTFGARGSPAVDPWSFLLPMTPLVWVALLTALVGLIAVTALLLSCLSLRKLSWDIIESASASFIRVLLIQDVPDDDGWWWWERVMVGGWMLITLVLTKSYAGNLISQLAVRYIPEPFQTLEDVLGSSVTLSITKGTSDEQAFRTAKSGIYREAWDMKEASDRLRLVSYGDLERLADIVRDGDVAHMSMTSYSMMKLSQDFSDTGQCDFYIGGGLYLTSLESLAVAKGSSLLPALSRKVMQVAEGGLYWFWYRLNYPNVTSCLNAPSKFVVNSPLAIKNIWGMFVVLAGGGVASLFVFFLELLYYHLFLNYSVT